MDTDAAMDPDRYDEFGLFHQNAADAGLDWAGPPTVSRVAHVLDDGRTVSALRWGTAPPEAVLIHGGGQNAHTWDTVALAMGRPVLAIDLPGHGHSGDIDASKPVGPRAFAADVAPIIESLASDAALIVGMSLGGLTAMSLAAARPELVRRLTMIDVTPGAGGDKTAEIRNFLAGPEFFATFDEILERTMLFNPTRSESSLRRGILHNTVRRDDGTWVWRHQRGPATVLEDAPERTMDDFATLWDDLASITAPVQLILGDRSPVVDDDDTAEFRRRLPGAEILTVVDAGHSIQGDQPIELARLLNATLDA